MGIYADNVLPRILNVACGSTKLEPLRQRVCQGLVGNVVEIGFTRRTVDLVRAAGFTIKELDVFYEKDAIRCAGADSLGTALSP